MKWSYRILPDREFKITVIEMLSEVKRKMHGHSGNLNKNIGDIKKYQTEIMELKNTTTELKNPLEGFNSRLDETEERICELEIKSLEIIHSEEQKKKNERE